ncbi:MAG: hypothetical protein U0166_11405 [Acidobacteriota bacterium]
MRGRAVSPLRKTYVEERIFVALLFGGVAVLVSRGAFERSLDSSLKLGLVVAVIAGALGFHVFSLLLAVGLSSGRSSAWGRDVDDFSAEDEEIFPWAYTTDASIGRVPPRAEPEEEDDVTEETAGVASEQAAELRKRLEVKRSRFARP